MKDAKYDICDNFLDETFFIHKKNFLCFINSVENRIFFQILNYEIQISAKFCFQNYVFLDIWNENLKKIFCELHNFTDATYKLI